MYDNNNYQPPSSPLAALGVINPDARQVPIPYGQYEAPPIVGNPEPPLIASAAETMAQQRLFQRKEAERMVLGPSNLCYGGNPQDPFGYWEVHL
jgi:hypothetical protein